MPTNVTVTAAANGAWSTSLQGNDSIDPGASNTPPTTYYVVTFKDQNGANIQSVPFNFTGAGPANLDSQAPLVTIPSPTAPPNLAGLLAANQTWTGTNTFNGLTTLTGGTLGGSYAGNPTLTGNLTATAGQNIVSLYSLNNILYVDGLKYTTIQAAHDALPAGGGMVIVPAGTYSTSGTTLAITKSNVIIQGCGVDNTIIRSTSASLPTITVGSSLTAVQIRDCTIDHSPATALGSGAHGLSFASAGANYDFISNVKAQFNDIGISLGACAFGFLHNSIAQQNAGDGVRLSASGANSSLQWDLSNVLSQENGSIGFHVVSSGTGSTTLQSWNQVYTFANSGSGAAFQGVNTNPISGIRITTGFFGQDGSDEIFLDTFGNQHSIQNTYAELAGTIATGPSLLVPASNVGHGVNISVNNGETNLSSFHSKQNSYSGIASSASKLTCTGCILDQNGQAGAVGAATQSGMYIGAGQVSISGGQFTNTAGTTQKYGLFTTVDAVTMTGTRVDGNATAPIGSSVSLIQSRFLTGNTSDVMANSNIALGAGWGSTATVTSTQGSKERFFFTANAAGAGIASNPTITITWPVAWPSSPVFVCKQVGTNDGNNLQVIVGEAGASTSNMVLTWIGTPTTAKNYTFVCSGQ